MAYLAQEDLGLRSRKWRLIQYLYGALSLAHRAPSGILTNNQRGLVPIASVGP